MKTDHRNLNIPVKKYSIHMKTNRHRHVFFYLLEIIIISRSFENVLESPIKVVDIIVT